MKLSQSVTDTGIKLPLRQHIVSKCLANKVAT